MANKQQTAVEWLVEKLLAGEFINSTENLIDQAIEMEKQQIKNDYRVGRSHGQVGSERTDEQYYNETYGKGDKP